MTDAGLVAKKLTRVRTCVSDLERVDLDRIADIARHHTGDLLDFVEAIEVGLRT